MPRRDDVRRGRREVVHAQGRLPTRRPPTPSSTARSTPASTSSTPPTSTARTACRERVIGAGSRASEQARPGGARHQVPLHAWATAPNTQRRVALPHRALRRGQPAPPAGPIASTSTRSTCRTSRRRRRRRCARSTISCAPARCSTSAARNYAAYRLADSLWIVEEPSTCERFVTLQTQYSLVVRDLEREHVPLCREWGLGILPWSPLAGGFLTGKYEQGRSRRRPARASSMEGALRALRHRRATGDPRRASTAVAAEAGATPSAGRARVAARQAAGHVGDLRRAHDRAARRQPRRGDAEAVAGQQLKTARRRQRRSSSAIRTTFMGRIQATW